MCMQPVWWQFLKNRSDGRLEEPLVRQQDPLVKPSFGSPQPRHEIPGVEKALAGVQPELGAYDFFISYSWTRTREVARHLAKVLEHRGYTIFLDIEKLPPESPMEQLVPELVKAVRSSRAFIIFEIQLGEPVVDKGENDRDEAIYRGRTIRAPAVGSTLEVEWSWQTLELLASTRFLSIGDGHVYPTAFQQNDWDCFIPSTFNSFEELVSICEGYLQFVNDKNGS